MDSSETSHYNIIIMTIGIYVFIDASGFQIFSHLSEQDEAEYGQGEGHDSDLFKLFGVVD